MSNKNVLVTGILGLAETCGIKIDGDYLEFNRNSPNVQITQNFRLHEFLTKNEKNSFTRINANIIAEVQDLRDIFGSAIGISSSYRSPAYNRSVNGATSSEHILGNALDTYPINGDIAGWKKVVRENKKTGGTGYYKTFVHIDTGRTRFWNG
ncbi:YcbK family protein [Sphingobacterium thalpophilum]|uniref:YcbK family protein n=1 Tax=Sphingobacterium thalpophilum TaxID=259 RepID=UPI0024A637AF|nr:D-Ala-D-Ala carboxypeptidase family metallohydrolase [Sphingobacterium thalpophilum]